MKSKVLGAGPPDPLPDDDKAEMLLRVRAAQCCAHHLRAKADKSACKLLQFAPVRKYQMEGSGAPKQINARVRYIEKVNR